MDEESLFQAALDIASPEERQAFLIDACQGNVDLRRRVEVLLAAYLSGEKSLEPVSHDPAVTQDHTPYPVEGSESGRLPSTPAVGGVEAGTVLADRYRLIEIIGEGGMGEVWLAKQIEPVTRKVAVKLIKAGMDSKQVLNRFEAERQALALMDHPNIARVLDGGLTREGRPYFVMELVNGLPLTTYCDKARLSLRERLELFVPICLAVQHAHQKGIVHRDLKPSNILVTLYDGKPVPKIIDFGVAKATGGKLSRSTVSTQFGAVVGTFEYMAPEQAGFSALDVDTRADIYSLGVILYELLTGLRPFDESRLRQAALDELIRIIREEEPSRPSTRLSTNETLQTLAALRQTDPRKLMALMRGELDWIVMKCLEKSRERRYESASALSRDVQHYLTDEPVEACPPSRAYRIKKFASRHRKSLILFGAFLLLLMGGLITSISLARWALRSEEQAQQHLSKVRKALNQSDLSRRQAQAVSDFLVRAFRKPDPFKEGRQITIVEMLDQARAQLKTAFHDQPEVRAALLHALGQTYLGLGMHREAIRLLREARELREQTYGVQDRRTARTLGQLAWALFLFGEFDEGIKLCKQSLKLSRALWKSEELNSPVPETLLHLASMHVYSFRLEEALPLNEEALALTRKLKGEQHRDTARAMVGLARVKNNMGRHAEALKLAQSAEAILNKELGPNHAETLLARNFHAQALGGLHRWKNGKGLRMLEELYHRVQQRFGKGHPLVSTFIISELSRGYLATRQLKKALTLIEPALETLKNLRDWENHYDTVYGMIQLSAVHAALRDFPQALAVSEDALNRSAQRYGSRHVVTETAAKILVRLYPFDAQSISLNRTTLERLERLLGDRHEATFYCTMNLAQGYSQTDRHEEAEPFLQKALQRVRRFRPPESENVAAVLLWLGVNQMALGKHANAEPLLGELLSIRVKTMPHSWKRHSAESLLGQSHFGQRHFTQAEKWFTQGYEGLKKNAEQIPLRSRQARLGEAVGRLIDLYQAMKQPDKVKHWQKVKANLQKEK